MQLKLNQSNNKIYEIITSNSKIGFNLITAKKSKYEIRNTIYFKNFQKENMRMKTNPLQSLLFNKHQYLLE